MRILVLDDEAAIGRLICRVASNMGIESEAVVDTQAFHMAIHSGHPDLVMLDLQIGAYDGIEQLRFLSEQHYRNAIVLISGFDGRVLEVARQFGRQLGLNVVKALSKPIRFEELTEVFEDVLAISEPFTPERLMQAIADEELALDYQPIMTRVPHGLHQLEALVRWNHPVLGRLAPDRFIPQAEQSGEVIDALTEWVLRRVARDAVILQRAGRHVGFAINVSNRNLASLDFPDRMHKVILEAGIAPADICFEVTETVASSNPLHSMDVLSRLRLKGFNLAIDDFGVGYSSLKRLRQLPFSTLKIDRSFVSDMLVSRDSLAIVRSITDLARNMELSTIAEGVEDAETARALELMGVNALQGFYFARPMAIEKFPEWSSVALKQAV